MHPDDLFAADRYRDAVEAGDSYSAEYRLIDVDGRVRWFRDDAAPVRDASGTARFMQGVIFEVTDQKEDEAQLLESEQRFRELLENVRLAAITTDLEGRIVFVNEYFAELSGWWDDELLGRSWVETFVAGEGTDGERAFLAELAAGPRDPPPRGRDPHPHPRDSGSSPGTRRRCATATARSPAAPGSARTSPTAARPSRSWPGWPTTTR